jgi:hypothetical protein
VRLPRLSIVLSFSLMILAWTLPAGAQTVSQDAPDGDRTPAPPSKQEFHCHTGYPVEQCKQDILQLKTILSAYPVEALGHWTWVLVRSQDWKAISRILLLNPDSPAFTALESRETFLEEALFAHDAERTAELTEEWQRSMSSLLQLAVTHELGHAFCRQPNEAAADRFGEELRSGRLMGCRVLREARKNRIEAQKVDGPSPIH